MQFGEYGDLVASILVEWNRAEEAIKLSEQVGNKVVFPSIKELRYSGRRVVDALAAMLRNEGKDAVVAFFEDARFSCHRARHDAIDVATSTMAVELSATIKRLGHKVVLTAYPEFSSLWAELNEIKTKIAMSRVNRKNRDLIYSTIESVDFPALVAKFNRWQAADALMRELAKQERRAALRNNLFGYGGLALAVVGLVVGYLFWRFPHS